MVIDEVHSLLRGDRGGQTLCLIERLSRMAGVNPRRVGLSATIGDPERTGEFLSAGTGRDCIIPRFEEPRRTWRLSMEHFYITGPQATERALNTTGPVQAEVVSCEATSKRVRPRLTICSSRQRKGPPPTRRCPERPGRTNLPNGRARDARRSCRKRHDGQRGRHPTGYRNRAHGSHGYGTPRCGPGPWGYIFEHTRGRKCLVFVNSREEAEAVCTMLRQYCEANHEPDRFLIHHGNLSAAYRETAEEIMRDEEQTQTDGNDCHA